LKKVRKKWKNNSRLRRPEIISLIKKQGADAPESQVKVYFIQADPKDLYDAEKKEMRPKEQWKTVNTEIGEGTVAELTQELEHHVMPIPGAIHNLRMMLSEIMTYSDLKGIMITGVWGDNKVAGFGMLSDSVEVTADDIRHLAEAAGNQLESFKDETAKSHGVIYNEDKNIVVPG